jgi:hypothetical protein
MWRLDNIRGRNFKRPAINEIANSSTFKAARIAEPVKKSEPFEHIETVDPVSEKPKEEVEEEAEPVLPGEHLAAQMDMTGSGWIPTAPSVDKGISDTPVQLNEKINGRSLADGLVNHVMGYIGKDLNLKLPRDKLQQIMRRYIPDKNAPTIHSMRRAATHLLPILSDRANIVLDKQHGKKLAAMLGRTMHVYGKGFRGEMKGGKWNKQQWKDFGKGFLKGFKMVMKPGLKVLSMVAPALGPVGAIAAPIMSGISSLL